MFRKILVALDGSAQAMTALELAAELAAEGHSSIGIVHVIEWPRAVIPEALIFDERMAQEHRREVDELLARASATLSHELIPEWFVPTGEAAEQIVETARSWSADVIVMGTHGRGRFATFMLGSTANEVLRTAPCPVLLTGVQARANNVEFDVARPMA